MNVDLDKNWWIVNVAAGVVGIIPLLLADAFSLDLEPYTVLFFLTMVGLSFLWVFITRKERVPWAIAPVVGCFTFIAVALLQAITGQDTFNWASSLVVGLGAVVMAIIPNPRIEIKIGYFISMWFLVPGFLLSPLPPALRIILAVASVLFLAYLLWRNREAIRSASASG